MPDNLLDVLSIPFKNKQVKKINAVKKGVKSTVKKTKK